MLRKWGMLVVMLLITPVLTFAQTTGKVAGTVVDQATGDPLPGASVALVGTLQGTITDVNGEYFILGVPVGSYDVQASFVGFQTSTIQGVNVSAGKTREINFSLVEGIELEEIVVEYERPLIQKDAIGVPKVVTSEEIANLPVRGVANVAALQGGVVSTETSSNLFIRGGREQEVSYYVDGVRVIGAVAVPTESIQEQEMLIGSIPARYGDAMSGIISITTKGGKREFSGSIEAISSEVLDDYGYNNLAASVGGPLVGDKANFFLSGEYRSRGVSGPRAVGFPTLSEADYNFLQQNPQAVEVINDETGEHSWIPFPGDLIEQFGFRPINEDSVVAAINVPEGWHLADAHPNPRYAAGTYTADRFTRENFRPGNGTDAFALNGNVTLSPAKAIKLRLGGGFETSSGEALSYTRSIYAQDRFTQQDRDTWRMSGTWTHYLSDATFYQLQVDFSDYQGANYNNAFSSNVSDILRYGDIDHASNLTAQRYFEYNADSAWYEPTYQDGNFPNTRDIQNTFAPPGVSGSTFSQFHNQRFGFRANATTQVGLHQVEFGGEYEQRTNRFYNNFDTYSLGDYEGDYNSIGFDLIDSDIFYYGYNYLGTQEVDNQDINAFTGNTNFNMEPYRPIYYAGYISDKLEYKDIVLQIGARVDVFDNNSLILRDRYSLFPILRAGEVGGAPAGIGSDYAVYFAEGSGAVTGYRDLDGNFYDPNGQETAAENVRTNAAPQIRKDGDGNEIRRITPEVFKDYEPQSNFQPRIGVSFPVTDQALFYASYDVVTQRPSENVFDTIQQYRQATERSKRLNNPALEPEKTSQYELGFRQRLGDRSAVQISGFYRQIENKIQRRIVQNAFPSNYQSYENVDFGTVKGVEFEYDMRRTNNVQLNANYTLSFAQGTGADAASVAQIIWRQETNPFYPNFISPLDFDQRHKFNLTVDYRLGKGEGPMVGGAHPLENFGVNLNANVGTGLPYTRRRDESPLYTSFNGFLEGQINGETRPSTSLLNLRVDRKFGLGGADLTAFVWVQNLLDSDNVQAVYSQTGLADDDGYLSSPLGIEQVSAITETAGTQSATSFVDHYGYAARSPFRYGIPRQTRIGLRLNF